MQVGEAPAAGRDVGGYITVVPGVAGEFGNDGTGLSIGFALAAGKGRVRYHFAAGLIYMPFEGREWKSYQSSYGYTEGYYEPATVGFAGFHLEPATLGFPVLVHDGTVEIAIEPLIRLVTFDIGSADELAMSWQTGFGVQMVVNYGRLALTFSPFNVEIRPFTLGWRGGFEASGGLNWPVTLSVGRRF